MPRQRDNKTALSQSASLQKKRVKPNYLNDTLFKHNFGTKERSVMALIFSTACSKMTVTAPLPNSNIVTRS